jgi:hypothetical protein
LVKNENEGKTQRTEEPNRQEIFSNLYCTSLQLVKSAKEKKLNLPILLSER